MVAPRFVKLFAVAASAAFVCSMAGVPAYALTDTNLDETTGASTGTSAITPTSTDESSSLQNQPSADDAESMPDNPTKDLPQTVSEEIPDDATVVSEELAVTDDGEVMDLETGDTVTEPQIVGTVDKPADPLAKTDGESFIPVEVAEVKDAMGDTATAPELDDATDAADTEDAEDDGDVAESQQDAADDGTAGAVVRLAALQNNSYGAYWGTYNGTPAFFEADGTLFVQQAKGVIDVSEWQGQIDWQKAKNDGVEGAIIRISYGWDNGFDKQALRNISECKRLGIPFGIYSYSYAYDSTTAAYEGADMVSLLRQAGVQPGDLSYPVFYDLEKWTWTGHTPPTSPSIYDGIVNAWYAKLQAAGYTNLSVYSYTSYLDTALNSANIRNKTRWVASYGARANFPFATNDRGWQYTSQGNVAGIQGSVDLNAFGNKAGFVGRVEGSIRDVWMSLGGVGGVLGAPAGDMRYLEANGGGWSQVFEYGEVYVKKGGAASVSMQ
ncbi:glycoside hydrolase family 25 protein [Bifidobacterium pullorum]|uniref:glycoside hydrolase family 25 protein n=1 Tax=Bifidobacterium pullorum TaxID=78448 RepID=UPI003D153634